MQENRNASFCVGSGGTGSAQNGSGTVCIDTKRVLDSCRDRDCFEDTRVYLTCMGEDILANSSNVRTRTAKILWAYVGVDEVPFNCGFFRIKIRYYIEVEFEACIGVGRSQCFKGLAVLLHLLLHVVNRSHHQFPFLPFPPICKGHRNSLGQDL